MLYGTGMKPEDMNKPQVGISSVWWEGNPCNMHLMVGEKEGGYLVLSPVHLVRSLFVPFRSPTRRRLVFPAV